MSKIFCLMFSGRPLTDKICDVLSDNAREMIADDLQYQSIKGRDYEGEITTDFEHVSFAGVVGIAFHAILIVPNGETDVKFVIQDRDLDGLETAYWTEAKLVKLDKKRRMNYENN